MPNLTRPQLELCYKANDVTLAAVEGLELAVRECEYQVSFVIYSLKYLSLIEKLHLNSSDGIDGIAHRSATKRGIHTHRSFSREVNFFKFALK